MRKKLKKVREFCEQMIAIVRQVIDNENVPEGVTDELKTLIGELENIADRIEKLRSRY